MLVRLGESGGHAARLEIAPGKRVVLVLDFADHDIVARSPRKALRDYADAFGGVLDQRYRLLWRPEGLGHGSARVFDFGHREGRLPCGLVNIADPILHGLSDALRQDHFHPAVEKSEPFGGRKLVADRGPIGLGSRLRQRIDVVPLHGLSSIDVATYGIFPSPRSRETAMRGAAIVQNQTTCRP